MQLLFHIIEFYHLILSLVELMINTKILIL